MSVKAIKNISITIDERDVDDLRIICEFARRHINRVPRPPTLTGLRRVDEYDEADVSRINALMMQLFEASS